LRFGIMATGGVGGYFGGLLSRAGEDIRFIARGKHLEAIRSYGLRIESVDSEFFKLEKVFATDNPNEAGPCDIILYCVKTVANEKTIPAIAPMVGDTTVIINLQNGVDNEEHLAKTYGQNRVMGGAAYIFTALGAPGLIQQIGGPKRIVFGEMGGGPSKRGEEILSTMRSAGINAELSDDIQVELWTKFIFICAVSGMTALTRSPLGVIVASPETHEMMHEIMCEVYEVGRAQGVDLPEDVVENRFRFLDEQNPASKGSLCHDLEAGRRLEIDALCGTVSRMGKEIGIPTPLNDFIYRTLKLADMQISGEIKPIL